MSKRAVTAAAAVLLACGLAGCQAIPVSGPVHEGLANLSQADRPVQFNPGGPSVGASQEEIVRGFVRAGLSSLDDYAVARQFLTPEYAEQWDPSFGVFIDDGSQPFRYVDENVGELSLSGIATIDEHGVMTPVPSGPATSMRFELQQVRGEWRIASAPNGVILDRSNFAAVWTPRQLYFLTADNRLVGETHWFLNRSATLSTQIVSELLVGPADYDAEALRTAFPSGTTLTANAVPVSGGTARIEFSPELLTGPSDSLELVKRQLAASLQSVPGVERFEIVVNGAVVDSGQATPAGSEVRGSEHTQPAVLKDGVFGVLNANGMEPLPGIGEKIGSMSPLGVTVGVDQSTAAVRHQSMEGEAVSWVSQDDVVTLDLRAGLRDPGLDPFGYVWSYATSAPGQILVQRPGEESRLLGIPGEPGLTPVSARVSPGGNRLAVLAKDADGDGALLVTSIVRDGAAVPIGLAEEAAVMEWFSGEPVDFDWVDEWRVVSLSASGSGVKATITPLGQLSLEAGSVPSAVAVSGGGSRSAIRVLDTEGLLYGPQGGGWQRQGDGVEMLGRW